MFTSLTAFDLHRTSSHAHSTRRCLDPATVRTRTGAPKLIPVIRPHWYGWATAGEMDAELIKKLR
jgi:hypothetical protein